MRAKAGPAEDKPKTASHAKFCAAVFGRLWQPIGNKCSPELRFFSIRIIFAVSERSRHMTRQILYVFQIARRCRIISDPVLFASWLVIVLLSSKADFELLFDLYIAIFQQKICTHL